MLLDFTFSINLDDYSIKKICLFVVFCKKNIYFCSIKRYQKGIVNKCNPKNRYNLYFKNYIFILIRIENEKALSSDRT